MTRLAHIDDPMTVEEFLAFTETRPDEEKWELIEGEPIMNATPAHLHQIIVGNLIAELTIMARRNAALWRVIPGIGVRLSDISAPVPDVMIRPRDLLKGVVCDDMIVAFEVLSPSTAKRDLRWKRKAYASLSSLAHYVVIAQDAAKVATYDRASGFAERTLGGLDGSVDLALIGVSLPLRDIYRDTGIA
ncbi:MAG: Uma2 family endonuclease [Hyphomicrobiales bacterium]